MKLLYEICNGEEKGRTGNSSYKLMKIGQTYSRVTTFYIVYRNDNVIVKKLSETKHIFLEYNAYLLVQFWFIIGSMTRVPFLNVYNQISLKMRWILVSLIHIHIIFVSSYTIIIAIYLSKWVIKFVSSQLDRF